MDNNMTIPVSFYQGDTTNLNRIEEPIPEVVSNGTGSLFGSLTSGNNIVVDSSMVNETEVKKRKRKTKKVGDTEVVLRDDNKNTPSDTLDVADYTETYQDTTSILKGTIAQIDALSMELKSDIDTVRQSRTMKGKYKTLTDLNSAMGVMLNTKVSAIKEINNSIKIANDMNYKKRKDLMAVENQNDDKYIMDMYAAYVNNPYGNRQSLVPSIKDVTLYGAGNVANPNITAVDVGAPVSSSTFVPASSDVTIPGTMNNPSVLTPEQNYMYHESDPNIQMCVVYDKATANKWFQVMNIVTKEPVPNMPVKDPMFLEDTTIDVRNGVARNTNLNETYPLIIINEDKFSDF